jgi:biopolymer transport protein ExbD
MKMRRLKLGAMDEMEEMEFQLAPMIDVIFMLLVFFIICAKITRGKELSGIQVPYAKSSSARPDEGGVKRVIIDVQSDPQNMGRPKITINTLEHTLEELPAFLQKQIKLEAQFTLRADQEIQYRYVKQVMEACSKAGVVKLSFATIREQSKQEAAPPGTVSR